MLLINWLITILRIDYLKKTYFPYIYFKKYINYWQVIYYKIYSYASIVLLIVNKSSKRYTNFKYTIINIKKNYNWKM